LEWPASLGRIFNGIEMVGYHHKSLTEAQEVALAAKEHYLLNHLSKGTKVLIGYVNGGEVTVHRSAFAIARKRWNSPSTLYRLAGGKILTGDEVSSDNIPRGTFIFFEQ